MTVPSSPRVIVTGTGRCGTEWCAQTLRTYGIPTGHQAVLRHAEVLSEAPIDWGEYRCEVSYEAAPLVGEFARAGCRIVLVHRHPYLVARSWVGLGAFDDDTGYDSLHEVLRRWCPNVLTFTSPIQRALVFWYQWTMLALPVADVVLPIWGLTPERLLAACGIPAVEGPRVFPDSRTNHRDDIKRPTPMPTADDIPSGYRAAIERLATMFGYEL